MRIPKYRKHSSRDIAFVQWQGRRHYLKGRHNSAESRAAYRRFIVEVVAAAPPEEPQNSGLTVAGLVTAFLDYAARRYGRSTRGEYANCKHALVPLAKSEYGPVMATAFGPKLLKQWRSILAKMNARGYVNTRINKVKRAFRWAASEELIPVTTFHALASVAGLQAGETEARETNRRQPVPWESIGPVLLELSPVVRAMVMFQWHTAARSQSICRAMPGQFNLKSEPGLWLWRPRHKTERLGRQLVIPIGPQCQAVIRSYLERCKPDGYLFDPRTQRANRRYGKRYTTTGYYRAVARAIKRVNDKRKAAAREAGDESQAILIDHWFPHQLRHSKGHAIREKYGIEGAQAHLGHDSMESTALYSARRLEIAKQIARETG